MVQLAKGRGHHKHKQYITLIPGR